jgi:hypothetical protein
MSFESTLLEAVRERVGRPVAVLVRTPVDPAGPELLAVLEDGPPGDPAHVPLRLPDGGGARLETVSLAGLDAIAAKVGRNLRSVPGTSLIRFGSLPAGDGRRASLPGLRPSGAPLRLLASAASRSIPVLERFRPRWRKGVKLSYMTLGELGLIEKLQSWRTLDGGPGLEPFWRRLHASGLPLQIALLYTGTFSRSLEDVEGMTGVHMASAVALAARIAFAGLARTIAASRGALRSSDQALLEWARTQGPELHGEFVRGLFPDPDRIDAHVEWLREVQARHLGELRRNWLFRILIHEADRWVETNAAPAERSNLGDAEYVPPPVPSGTDALDGVLERYGTSTADLVAMVPCPPDAAIRLTGSIAEGWGHARSDVDLVVLTSTIPELTSVSASVAEGHYESRLGATPAGNGVWVEYLDDRLLDRLGAWADEAAADLRAEPELAAGRLRGVRSSPMARLYHRAMRSLVLRDGESGRRWEARLPAETYASAMVASHLLEHRELERQAGAWAAADPVAALLAARRAWSHALLALLASRGTFVWGGERWIPSAIARLGDPDLAVRARRGLLPAAGGDAAAYLAWLREQDGWILDAIAERVPRAEAWAARAPA